jgi:hypothetical protein
VRSSASSFNLQYRLFSLRSSSSCLRLLPRLTVISILPSSFPSITCFIRQFVLLLRVENIEPKIYGLETYFLTHCGKYRKLTARHGKIQWVQFLYFFFSWYYGYVRTIPVAARSKAWGLRPLVFWDFGFESRRGHGCLSLVSVVCCQVEVSASG